MQYKAYEFVCPIVNLNKSFLLLKKQIKHNIVDQSNQFELNQGVDTTISYNLNHWQAMISFWKLLDQSYFKQISAAEQQSLTDRLLTTNKKGKMNKQQIQMTPYFQNFCFQLFDKEYLAVKTTEKTNWLQTMQVLINKIEHNQEIFQLQKIFQQFRTNRNLLLKSKKRQYNLSKLQKQFCKQLQNIEFQEDAISIQIKQLTAELDNLVIQQITLINQIKYKVYNQKMTALSQLSAFDQKFIQLQQGQGIEINDILNLIKIQQHQEQQKYLFYQIGKLQLKQIAESISKTTKVQNNINQLSFVLDFEDAIELPKKQISQAQFINLNSKRQLSLMQFYFTGCKSIYNYTSQNFAGFKAVYQKNTKQRLSSTTQVSLENENKEQILQQSICQFQKMKTCHQFINLKKCQYSSVNDGVKNKKLPYFNSYFRQIYKYQHNQFYKLLSQRPQYYNHYLHYIKVGNQYICNRYYCHNCLKSYPKVKSQRLCPYCLGYCTCTRCLRNDTIYKLKSILVCLGGNIDQLQKSSYYFTLYQSQYKQNQLIENNNNLQLNKKELTAKLTNYRVQLQNMRIICNMIKKRQRLKLKYFKTKAQTFKTKLQILKFKLEQTH